MNRKFYEQQMLRSMNINNMETSGHLDRPHSQIHIDVVKHQRRASYISQLTVQPCALKEFPLSREPKMALYLEVILDILATFPPHRQR